jgi:hypothetical protein
MSRDKIESALSAALRHLEDSLNTLSNNGAEKAVSDSLWSASAEIEYAVFLLSLMLGDKAEDAPWKYSASSKHSMEFKPALTSALELLKNAKTNIEMGGVEKCYEEAWTARNMLLKAQELLEKKRKEARKKTA